MLSTVLGRFGTLESRILVLGLDAAGKTTLVSMFCRCLNSMSWEFRSKCRCEALSGGFSDVSGKDHHSNSNKLLQAPSTCGHHRYTACLQQSTIGNQYSWLVFVIAQLYKLKVGEAVTTIPTIGFNVETLKYKRCEFTAWDIGGQEKLRRLWAHYFAGTSALIYVVDSCDNERLAEAAEELRRTLDHDDMRDCSAVLVYANKQDLPGALSPADIALAMDLESAAGPTRKWWVQGAVAPSASGLYEGLDWLADRVTEASR